MIVTLKNASDSNGKEFKGFMIQARVMADDSPVGTWKLPSLSDQLVQTVCPDDVRKPTSGYYNVYNNNYAYLLQTAATHIDGSQKTSITLSWKAPPAGTGAIRFRYVASWLCITI